MSLLSKYIHVIFFSCYSDITTGSWFQDFSTECTLQNHTPIAIDIYYDDWKVSKLHVLYL